MTDETDPTRDPTTDPTTDPKTDPNEDSTQDSIPAPQFADVYDTLRALARGQRRRAPHSDTLNTTALVHEAYLKLFTAGDPRFADRAHFMAVAATAMRHILIGNARRHATHKRGGGKVMLSLSEADQAAVTLEAPTADTLLALDGALDRLKLRSERQSKIVECRFFGGMSIAETADALDISPATVKRDWQMAQAWLHRELMQDMDDEALTPAG